MLLALLCCLHAFADPAVYYGHHEAEFGMMWCAGKDTCAMLSHCGTEQMEARAKFVRTCTTFFPSLQMHEGKSMSMCCCASQGSISRSGRRITLLSPVRMVGKSGTSCTSCIIT